MLIVTYKQWLTIARTCGDSAADLLPQLELFPHKHCWFNRHHWELVTRGKIFVYMYCKRCCQYSIGMSGERPTMLVCDRALTAEEVEKLRAQWGNFIVK